MSVFLRAIDIINERGWTKGAYHRTKEYISNSLGRLSPGYCLVGACSEAANPGVLEKVNMFEGSHEYRLLTQACRYWSPTAYNDKITTSKDDVIDILRKAYEYECQLNSTTVGSG